MGRRLRVVGPGRMGGALMLALGRAGWTVAEPVGRHDPVEDAAEDVDLLAITTPDAQIGEVASAVRPVPTTVVLHCSGALRLDVLGTHERRASLHPLVPFSTPQLGADRLVGAWFAVAGDALAGEVLADLAGHAIQVPEARRTEYHAAAAIASNHLVALLGQVERIGARAGVPLEAYLALARATLDNVAELSPAEAITGPIQRGDWATVRRHLEAIDPSERAAYEMMADQVARLVRRQADLLEHGR